MGALDAVADRIVHGARESFLRTLTNRLVSALRGLVSGTTSEARAANALDMASARVAEQAMGTWAEFRPKVTEQVATEVGQALRQRDETLQRDLVRATGADGPWGLTNRARNDLAEATRGVREVVGRQNVAGMTEADRAASKAAAAESMQGAADAHHAAQAWYEVAGAAVTRVDMGDDPEAVLADAVAELARRGLETVDYKSGRSTTVDAAVRRHIDSQLNQAANDMAIRQCDEWGVGLVMVDAHWGARPSHAAWQGKAYSLHGATEVDGVTYEDLYEATGYQGRNGWPLGAQLAGVNCRHRIYPYVPGESVIPGTAEGEMEAYEKKYGMTSEEYYEATQRQRAMERELRAAKREAAFLEDEGLDATAQRYRIGELQRRLRELCRTTGLERDPTRERAYGVTHQPRGLKRPAARPERLEGTAGRKSGVGQPIKWPNAGSRLDKDERKALRERSKRLGVRVEVGKNAADIDAVTTFLDATARVRDMFPSLSFDERKPLTLAFADHGQYDLAVYSARRPEALSLNAGLIRSLRFSANEMRENHENREFAGKGVESIIYHEFAHLVVERTGADPAKLVSEVFGIEVRTETVSKRGKMYGKKRLMISAEDHEMLRMWCRKSLGSSYAADSLFDKDAPEKGFDFEELVAECVSSWCCGGADEKAAAIAGRLGGDR